MSKPTSSSTKSKPRRPLPGDLPRETRLSRMLRVDHAGEFGAARIYEGQLAVFGDTHRFTPIIREMKAQEQKHLDTFDELLNERQVRPTLLGPLWHGAGFALGAATALMGERAAMACTAAVEEVIDEHYAEQSAELENDPDESDLRATIEEFRADEAEHRETALSHDAEKTPGYPVMASLIKLGCRAAIWASQRV
ncbi:MAG: demethoxyubiquinone hydroxylase family protein [Pseudomonadota bacterium]